MASYRRRTFALAGLGVLGVWLVAGAGWFVANRAKATAEKVAAYLHEADLAKLSAEKRAKALHELSTQVAALPVEERRKARLDAGWEQWFAAMTDQEKGSFIEATMPGGFKQLIASFEQLPEDKRRRAVSDALRDLKKARDAAAADPQSGLRINTNRPPGLSAELQQQLVDSGLQTFYSESSAQTKADLAPLLEEMLRLMESGALLRGPRR